jgi:hypothetical protein
VRVTVEHGIAGSAKIACVSIQLSKDLLFADGISASSFPSRKAWILREFCVTLPFNLADHVPGIDLRMSPLRSASRTCRRMQE